MSFPDFELQKPGTENPGIENQGISKSGKLKIRETQNLGNPKSGKLLYGHNGKIQETQKPGTENPGIENKGISKSWKLKIRETQNQESCYMVIRWFDGGIDVNDSSPHMNYHMLTLRLRRR